MKQLSDYVTEKANFLVKKHIEHMYAQYEYGCIMELISHKLTLEEINILDGITTKFNRWANEYVIIADDEKEYDLDVWINDQEHPIILLTIVAMCLIKDNELKNLDLLGQRNYPGQRNPYDCGCFEEEDCNGNDVLDYVKCFIDENESDWGKFYDVIYKYEDNLSDDPGTLWSDLVNSFYRKNKK